MGVDVTVLNEGNTPPIGSTVTIHYVGTLVDGTVFDSSRKRGQPFSFKLGAGQVVKGWDHVVVGMKVGETSRLTISPDFGYGARGDAGGIVPPNATLTAKWYLLFFIK
ncbi:hypothetical protein ACTFIW_005113 [Dictyostelium discoideum]